MSLIRAFTHLANQPRAPEALYTLKRIADLAYPIMKQHRWVIPVLSEFFPDDERLLGLNINSGDKILIRLRPARSPGTFYPIEQLVRVMLHELTHNVHGPHDERFYSLLNKLEDEYDTLVTSGWQGSGFYAPGERLGSKDQGGRGNRNGGSFDIGSRRKAPEAAEARLKIERSRSGGRLGGSESSARAGRTIQELAANAADRRRRDKQTCAASHPSADREAARAAVDSIASVVEDADLAEALQLSSVLAEPVDHPNSTRAMVTELPTSLARVVSDPNTHGLFDESIIEISDSDSEGESISPRAHPSSNGRQCPSCTYLNPPGTTRDNCKLCEALLPNTFVQSQEEPWACAVCTLSNRPAAQRCEACDFPEDRSHWAPKLKIHGGASEVKALPSATWTCGLCTLINVYASKACSLCGGPCPLIVPPSSGPSHKSQSFIPRPRSPLNSAVAPNLIQPLPWDCQNCGRRGIEHDSWMCGGCGWMKTNSVITQ